MPAHKITECCANCFFARQSVFLGQFIRTECRFDAPKGQDDKYAWPLTSLEHWCGKYKFDSQRTNGIFTNPPEQEKPNAESID